MTRLNVTELLEKEFVRFAIVGMIATGIHYGIYLLLQLIIETNIAYTIGYVVSLCCNFILTARFTFRAKTSIGKGIGFAGSHLVNYLIHIGLLNLFIYMGINPEIAPIPVYCIAIPVNFILVRTVFKKKVGK